MNWASIWGWLVNVSLNQKLPSLWAAHNSFSRFNTMVGGWVGVGGGSGGGFKHFTKERLSPDNFDSSLAFYLWPRTSRGGGRGAVFGWGGRAGRRDAGVTEGLWKTSLDKVRGILETALGFIEDWVLRLPFNLWNNWWLRGFQGWEGNLRGRGIVFLFYCLQVIITHWSHHGRM